MMWNYVSLPDETQIAYSDIHEDGTVSICVERPAEMGFDSARCVLPVCRWEGVEGFSESEIEKIDSFVRNNAPLIFELAQRKGDEKTMVRY